MRVRAVRADEAEALEPLLAALGYPTPAHELRARLERLASVVEAGVLVADTGGPLLGFASFQTFELVYRPRPQMRLTALAVSAAARRRGVGRALVEAVEAIARERHCFRVEVTSSADRPEAHAFYRSLGYEERRLRFVKSLP